MKITIEAMTGKQSKVAPTLLQDNQAQVALNARVEQREIHSWPLGTDVASLTAGTYQSLFRYYDGTDTHWIASENDVDWVISPISNDTYKRLFFTGETEPRAFANDILSSPWDATTDYYKIGHTPPVAAITTATGYSGGSSYRAWYYTYVNRYGEESGPSPIKAVTNYGSGSAYLTGYSEPTAGFGINEAAVGGRKGKIRVYRSTSSSTGAEFQFAVETDVDELTNFTTLQIYDDTPDADLGIVCPTEAYDIGIPSGITGLVGLSSGMMAGFVGNTVYFSDVLLPGSWSNDFKVSYPYNIVGLAPFGAMLFVLTEGHIYIVIGSDPTNLQSDKFEGFYPCLSKRGIAVSEYGVSFPSYEGLVLVNHNGPVNMTFDFLTEKGWNNYYPSYMHGKISGGKYFGFYKESSAVYGGFVFDIKNSAFTDLQDYYSAAYVAEALGKFYIIDGIQIKEWGADPFNYMYFTWKSKEFVLPYNTNLTCARVFTNIDFYNQLLIDIANSSYLEDLNAVIFAAGDFDDAFNEDPVEFNVMPFNSSTLYDFSLVNMSPSVTFKLYADKVLKMTKTFTGDRMFRLPSGFRARRIEVEVSSYLPIQKIVLADNPKELN